MGFADFVCTLDYKRVQVQFEKAFFNKAPNVGVAISNIHRYPNQLHDVVEQIGNFFVNIFVETVSQDSATIAYISDGRFKFCTDGMFTWIACGDAFPKFYKGN